MNSNNSLWFSLKYSKSLFGYRMADYLSNRIIIRNEEIRKLVTAYYIKTNLRT